MTPILATLLATAALFIIWLDWITTDTPARQRSKRRRAWDAHTTSAIELTREERAS